MMGIRFFVCLGFLFDDVFAGWSCNDQFATSYLCLSAGVARPIAQIGSAPAVEVYFGEAWRFWTFVKEQAGSQEVGGSGAAPYYVLVSTNGNNIPSDMDDVSNPENCTRCATDAFAPVGDTSTIDTVRAASTSWAYWNVFYITIWVASANVIFDTHCTGNCVSHHPSRKHYFRAGMENIIAMATPARNQTVYLFANPSSISTDVIAPLWNALDSETVVDAFWVRINTMDVLTEMSVQSYLSAAPENDGDSFMEATHPIDGVIVAAENGQVEPLLLGMSNQRPVRVMSMNTKILADHDIPENTVDAQLFAQSGQQPNLQECVMTPSLRADGLTAFSRQWLWDISTSTQRNGWQGIGSSLFNTTRYKFVQQALAAISIDIIDITGQPRDPWTSGYAPAEQLVGDARQDISYFQHAFDPQVQAIGMIAMIWGWAFRIQCLIDYHVRFRLQNLMRDCATMAFGAIFLRPAGLVRRHHQNPFWWVVTSGPWSSGAKTPPPQFAVAEQCWNTMGQILNDPDTGESMMGMYLTQKNNDNNQHIVLPVHPYLYPSETIMETAECIPLPATTTMEQVAADVVQNSRAVTWRFLMICTIGLIFWI